MNRTILLFIILSFLKVEAMETKDLKYIGMPVNGICTGQIYLGGDGQLWNWDIFNVSMLNPGNEAGCRFYINPLVPKKTFENGFGIKVKQGYRKFYRPLNKDGFSDISFNGQYPIGNVKFKDVSCPVEVNLKAYSPFIPTDADNSGLPVTILEYTVENLAKEELEIELSGWMQNMSGYFSAKKMKGKHFNRVQLNNEFTQLSLSCSEELKETCPDWGNMTLTLLEKGKASARANYYKGIDLYLTENDTKEASEVNGRELVGSVSGTAKLKVGEKKTFKFMISWFYPNVHLWNAAHNWKDKKNLRHYYSEKFSSSKEVTEYVMKNKWLMETTKSWTNNWYNSSLPTWFLDRTFVNVATLATNACLRFNDITDNPENEGRFYTFEGVYMGPGTCTHVFHYEQVMGRVFPKLARQLREQIDLGLSFKDGVIGYRGEFSNIGKHDGRGYAVDGHAGTILRIYREHTMSSNNDFLKKNWKKIKASIDYMIEHDKAESGEADGILEGVQYNTLDRIWYGKNTWISGLYAAALKAGEQMAKEMKDYKFSKQCATISNRFKSYVSKNMFNGEYFTHIPDPKHDDTPNTNNGCHTDQLLGQYWATQVGLSDILPNHQVKSALKSIVKYNFVDNYGEYLRYADIPIKRWFADDDEPGIIMCTFLKGGADIAAGNIKNEWEKTIIGYFSEIWTGQEHQLAAALLSEGLIDEAYKVIEGVNSRYNPKRRNPYNEIEYGNHYTRAMSGYAPFVSASGFTYNGPKGELGFDPKIEANRFNSAFITSKSWGEYSQKIVDNKSVYSIEIKHGQLNLNKLKLNLKGKKANNVNLVFNGENYNHNYKLIGNFIEIDLNNLQLKKSDLLTLVIS
jgi:uncharacterized protein (DUF608 family)